MTKSSLTTPAYRDLLRSQTVEISVYATEEGIRSCLFNAREFLTEATLLSENKHNRHAVGLLELAVEELGKAQHMAHCLEDATILGEKSATITRSLIRLHKWKLRFSPKGHVRIHSREERRMRNRLTRFYSAGTTLRERSFYVDYKRGRWQWGNLGLEEEKTISFVGQEVRIESEMIESQLANVLRARGMTEKFGLYDARVQRFLRKTFGKTTRQKIREGSIIRVEVDVQDFLQGKDM